MATGFLSVKGTQLFDGNGTKVVLRGAALGGWLNMENFLTGYPGHESGIRAAMRESMGEESYEFFFDRWLYHFFTEKDAKFFRSLGLNCLRLAFNHRHFEDDMNPRVLKESGFKHLDRVVKLCAEHGIYTILDLHTVPGAQNQDWHSDNPTNYAAFWDYKDHQDRAVWLWEQIAQRYKDNTWVAGYNPVNEPADPSRSLLASFYARIEKAIRAIDPVHILFLDGNTYAMEWEGFNEILPNCVYSIHDYSMMGFPEGELYRGTPQQDAKLRSQFLRKCEFNHKHNVPIWNGEFGPTYALPGAPDEKEINKCRYDLFRRQLQIYEEEGISWSVWTYKDIGLMGMISTRQDSAYNQLIKAVFEKKQLLYLDGFSTKRSPEVEAAVAPLVKWIDEFAPNAKNTYPLNWDTKNHVMRSVIRTFVAQSLCKEFAELFKGKTHDELEELARCFSFEECVLRDDLNQAFLEYTKGR
ncbi:putative glucanase [Aspergillus karnatakaensis]|uniref:glycoside hydrolase family 5 protein n=1 Tax=Aspergillus karnatakaensis TaxID=1810916 RepID=UPI003CCD999D